MDNQCSLSGGELARYDRQIILEGFGEAGQKRLKRPEFSLPGGLGVAPGVIGCIQAAEVVKYITGIGRLLTGRLLIYDGSTQRFSEVNVKRDPNCPHCGQTASRR